MSGIHPTAIIEDGAVVPESSSVGPYSIIGPGVTLGENVDVKSHVVIGGNTTLGDGCKVFPFASVGLEPQDLKYKGEDSRLEIGKNTIIRENATINPGTEGGGMVTKIGDNCLLMACAHVAHDCIIGNNVILVNNSMIAGHCILDDFVIVGGGSGVRQFVHMGEHSFANGLTGVAGNVIPFGSVTGSRGWLQGLNLIGLRRREFDREQIHRIRQAYRLLFSDEGTLTERVDDTSETFSDDPVISRIIDFIRNTKPGMLLTPHSYDGPKAPENSADG